MYRRKMADFNFQLIILKIWSKVKKNVQFEIHQSKKLNNSYWFSEFSCHEKCCNPLLMIMILHLNCWLYKANCRAVSLFSLIDGALHSIKISVSAFLLKTKTSNLFVVFKYTICRSTAICALLIFLCVIK